MINNNQRQAALGVVKTVIDQAVKAGLFNSAEQVIGVSNAYNILVETTAAAPVTTMRESPGITNGAKMAAEPPAQTERVHADGSGGKV